MSEVAQSCCRCVKPAKVTRDNRLYCVDHWRAEVSCSWDA
jgi:hypothetical protein